MKTSPNKTRFIFFLIGAVLLCTSSCSTRKNNAFNRAWHTTTSKFNVNFNGKEALKTGEAELEKKYKDNYTVQLPIYYYPAKSDLASILSSMDRTIEKASKAIYKHSIFIKGKEYVKTMDDAYLMMGKAYFYKQDYNQAGRIFNYMGSTYKGWKLYEEAMIWNARTTLRQNYYSRSQQILDDVHAAVYDKKKKKLNVMYSAAMAEYNLTAPDGELQTAIDYIHDAIDNKPKKDFKVRLYFILGQLYEQTMQLSDASNCFKYVAKKAPNYDMEFNAKMHLATNYDGTASSRAAILKVLRKMLEEKKNVDYKDQIYYAISEIARIDEDEPARMENLALSVAAYKENSFQRTFSSVTLADIFFEKNEYMQAQAYYDTAVMSIPKNYPNYDQIIKKSKVLRELVDNLQVILLQDSLQRIAKMSEGQRNTWVRQRIAAYTEEERRLAKEEADRMLLLQSSSNMTNINVNTTQSNKWYFYNSALISAGQTEFFRRWGTRKLEDNWFVTNKTQISFDDMAVLNDPSLAVDSTEYDDEGNAIKKRETDPKEAAYYLQDLPLTQGKMDTSNILIANALYNSGLIYMEQLDDYPRANESFETLYNRFPQNELALPSLFLLYMNYKKENNPKYETPKNIILTQYPNTDYAKLISDPNYYEKLKEKEMEMENRYETLYQSYSNKDWTNTKKIADESIPLITDKLLKSKYAYLRAVAVGQLQGEDSLKRALADVIINYAGFPVEELAKVYLSLYADNDQVLAQAGDTVSIKKITKELDEKENPFVISESENHYVVIILNASTIPVLEVKHDISNFNKEFFSLQKYNINSFYIDKKSQMVTISKFKNKETAMDYYDIMIRNEKFANNINNKNITIFALSSTNYTTYYNKPDKRDFYPIFFNDNYLKK